MGAEITARSFSRADRRAFRAQVQACTSALRRMLDGGAFDGSAPAAPLLGMEIELNLVHADMSPAMSNLAVLDAIDDHAVFQTELGQFNIEMNVAPSPLGGAATLDLERSLRDSLRRAGRRANRHDAQVVMVGMLPTLGLLHLGRESITENPRYQALDDQIFIARGEDIEIDLDGIALPGGADREDLHVDVGSVVPEAACTSLQLHLEVTPDRFGDYWNAAQAIAGPQVALAANSPFLAGRALWHETRIPLFAQATDTRTPELKNQGVRGRVWFGERWIESVIDLFDENVRYFPALLPEVGEIDPNDELDQGRIPLMPELTMHNGTIYRWNRPVYAVVDDVPHLREENRLLPAGPTVVDMMANAAFYYGLVRTLADQDVPIWRRMSFGAAHENLELAARHGMDARQYWPGVGWLGADELVLRLLVPAADEGLAKYGVSAHARERYLGVIAERARTRRTGAAWQRARVVRAEENGASRTDALAEMLREYVEHMNTGEPVHTWPVDSSAV